jgi:hypothetical protein
MNLNDMTVSELRKLAAQFDISGRSTMKKAELIAALSADEFAGPLEIMGGIAELEAEEREMNEIRAEIAAEAAYIEEGIERDEAADVEAGELLDAALGDYIAPTGSQGQIAITKFSTHEAIATAAFDADSIGGRVTRERGRWVLRDGDRTVRAKTLGKVAKLWAKQLGIYATTIDIEALS